jgi:hypothetical protein
VYRTVGILDDIPPDGECVQILVHPATSVWAVSTMPNGDIVSGSSDRMVRVFSASADRWASEEDIKAYDDVVAQQALPAHDVDEVKTEGMDALNTPGTSCIVCQSRLIPSAGKKIGQTKIVLNGDIPEVYQVRDLASDNAFPTDWGTCSGTARAGRKSESAQRDPLMTMRKSRSCLKANYTTTSGTSPSRMASHPTSFRTIFPVR